MDRPSQQTTSNSLALVARFFFIRKTIAEPRKESERRGAGSFRIEFYKINPFDNQETYKISKVWTRL